MVGFDEGDSIRWVTVRANLFHRVWSGKHTKWQSNVKFASLMGSLLLFRDWKFTYDKQAGSG